MGDRGKWDAARVATLMLAAFTVSTWGLELSLDLAVRTDGPVDLLNRPPPVISSGDATVLGDDIDWIVRVRKPGQSTRLTTECMHRTRTHTTRRHCAYLPCLPLPPPPSAGEKLAWYSNMWCPVLRIIFVRPTSRPCVECLPSVDISFLGKSQPCRCRGHPRQFRGRHARRARDERVPRREPLR